MHPRHSTPSAKDGAPLSAWALAVLVAVFVLAVDLVRAQGAVERCAGAGPVQITVRRQACMCEPTPAPPVRKQDGTYLYEYQTRDVLCACDPSPEIWSDYPECGGWRLD